MKYTSLHHHTTFSYGDGFGTPEQHVARAAELEMEALAFTEHGNITSHVRLEKAATKAGIKPLFGVELYTARRDMFETKNQRKWHLTVIAENAEGYHNLLQLVSDTWEEGFYRWPTAHWDMLEKYHKGLIVLSGCADSLLACDLLGGKGRELRSRPDYKTALRTVRRFQQLFGDNYFLECQQFPELERTRTLNPAYAELSRDTGVGLVATSDVHYPYPDDNEMQKILHAATRGSGTVEKAEASWEYDIRLTPPTSDDEIGRRLVGTGLTKGEARSAIANSLAIARAATVTLPKVDRLRYPMPDGQDPRELIWEWLRRGWKYRWPASESMRKRKTEYMQRLKYEMELIESKDFIDYFLMLSDVVRYAKNNGIPVGPARGSAAASLVCYILRITEIDPLLFPNMLFERFIDANRVDLPDIDLDFDDERRDELRQYLVGKYGDACVGNIGTFTRYRGKNSLVDVARVYSVPEYDVKVIKDLMVERSGGDSRINASLEDTIAMFPAAQEIMEKHPVLNLAKKLEGNYRGMSVHAAGLVVSNMPLTRTVAMYAREDKKNKTMRKVLSVDKYDAEYLGLMKADLLGLSTMGMIRHAIEHIGMSLDEIYHLPYDDRKTLAAFRANDVVGIFQFGGGATRIVNGNVSPVNFLELCDINALSRPGPLQSGQTQDYVEIKHGRKEPELIHPVYDEIVSTTKHQVVYQEQVLRIVREVGDFPWTHAATIRKAISLKWGESTFNKYVDTFIEGAAKVHGMNEETARYIWAKLVTSASYSLNVAHAVSYALIAYWTMWLKVHHPHAFYMASLRKCDDDAQFYLLRDAIKHKVEVLPPDPNKSVVTWSAEDGAIRAGLKSVPGIADKMASVVIKDREERGPFQGWDDLLRVKGIGPAKLKTMMETAASDDPFGIYRIDELLESVRDAIDQKLIPVPTPTHRADELPTESDVTMNVVYIGIPLLRDPRDVIEDTRMQTGEDYEEIRRKLDRPDLSKRMTVHCIDESDQLVYVRFSRYNYPQYQKQLWEMELGKDVLLVGGQKRAGFGTSIYAKRIWVLKATEED